MKEMEELISVAKIYEPPAKDTVMTQPEENIPTLSENKNKVNKILFTYSLYFKQKC